MTENKKKGTLIVVSGPSGAGKSTLIDRFLREDDRSSFSISYTTRQKREHEIDGKDYYFVSKNIFEEMVRQEGFLEWERVHSNMYGTPKDEVSKLLDTGKDIILDVDVKGAVSIREKCVNARLIFVEPPSREELIRRLTLRGEKEIELRMKRVDEEIAEKPLFGYTIVNDELENAYIRFKETITEIRRNTNGENNC
ncbi:MAG TPA: guanylate kinase [Syntrophorhabdaceae bacterium]|nr:guanylate kinase [Syntrophorhabdaceae bacterium]